MENSNEILYFYKLNSFIGCIFIIKSEKGLRSIELLKEKWKNFNKKYNLIEDKDIGNEKAVMAIGQANKANPIPIIIPCHRVIGKNNKLVGYAGNHTDIQEKLINFEKENLK